MANVAEGDVSHATTAPSRIVAAVIERSMLRNERVMAALRALFCCVILVRFFWVTEFGPFRALMELGAVVAALVFSGYVLLLVRRGTVALLFASVSIDAVGCFFALLPNIIYDKAFPSLLMMPDFSVLLLMVAATGLRHSAAAAAFGSALNLTSFVLLVLVDRAVKGPQWVNGPLSAGLYAIFILGVAAIAISVAARTRRLALRGASDALTAERARGQVKHILSEHHDLRSLLSAASVNVSLLERALADRSGDPETVKSVRELSADLKAVNAQVSHMLDHSFAESSALEAAPVLDILEEVAAQVGRCFPEIELVVATPPGTPEPSVSVRGGGRALRRALTNLAMNACEGDGRSRARRVVLSCSRDGGEVCLRVLDDGPGLPRALLEGSPSASRTTKPAGSGRGLAFARELALESEGTLTLENRPTGGACVSLRLREAPQGP